MHSRLVSIAIVIVICGGVVSPNAVADRMRDRQKHSSGKKLNLQTKFGLKGGGVGPGTVSIDGFSDYNTMSSYSLGFYIEGRPPRRVRVAMAVDLYHVKFGENNLLQKDLLNWSLEFKFPMRRAEPRLAFQPGVGAGFGYLGSNGYTEKCYLMTLKFFGEMLYYVTPKHGLSMELGFIFAPTGKTADSHTGLSTGPMLVYRAGLFL